MAKYSLPRTTCRKSTIFCAVLLLGTTVSITKTDTPVTLGQEVDPVNSSPNTVNKADPTTLEPVKNIPEISIPDIDPAKLQELLTMLGGMQEQSNSPINARDHAVELLRHQLHTTNRLISDLSRMLVNEQLRSLTAMEKKRASHALASYSQLISELQNERFINCDEQMLHRVLDIQELIIARLEHATATRCKKVHQITPNDIFGARSTPRTITISLQQRQQRIHNRLEQLDKAVEYTGLSLFNHAYRIFDSAIVKPCIKYDIPKRTAAASILGFGLMSLWWRLHHASFSQVMGADLKPAEKDPNNPNAFIPPNHSRLYNFWGPLPYNINGTNIPFEQLGTVGKLEQAAYDSIKSRFPIANGALMLVGGYLGYEFYNNVWPSLSKKLQAWHHRLKGGTYRSHADELDGYIKHVEFDDIIGLEHVKDYFKTLIAYLENPEVHDRLGITPQKGCLLSGPTRTGKTHAVLAFVYELSKMLARTGRHNEVCFLQIDAAMMHKWGADGFKKAMESLPQKYIVLFFDEADLLKLQRNADTTMLQMFLSWMNPQLTNKISDKQFIIIAATNRPETIDIAMRQHGRLGKDLRFEYPTLTNRIAFIRKKLQSLSLPMNQFNINRLAQMTEGKSYELLNHMIDAALFKSRQQQVMLTQQHLEDAIQFELYHIMKQTLKDIPVEEKRVLAAHFAGHALSTLLLDHRKKLTLVTIRQYMVDLQEKFMGHHLYYDSNTETPQYQYGNVFFCQNGDTVGVRTREEKIAEIKYYLAGIVAEDLLLGGCSHSCHTSDLSTAIHLAQSFIIPGIDIRQLPEQDRTKKFTEAEKLVEQCKKEMKELFTKHHDILQRLSQAMLEQETLTGDEVETLCKIKTAAPAA